MPCFAWLPWIAPPQLVVGYGILFKIDESCIPNHIHARRPKGLEAEATEAHPTLEQKQAADPAETADDKATPAEGSAPPRLASLPAGPASEATAAPALAFPDTEIGVSFKGGQKQVRAQVSTQSLDSRAAEDGEEEEETASGRQHVWRTLPASRCHTRLQQPRSG